MRTRSSLKMTFLLVNLLILGTVSPLYADPPSLTALSFLPGDRQIGVAPGSQTQPVIARGGDLMLAVWTDASSTSPLAGAQSELDIYAARLDAQGDLLDTTPFPISRDAGYQRDPQVAWNGQNWLVIWENQTFNGSYYESRVFGVRVSPEGVVLDAVPIQPLGSDAADEGHLAANGSEWLVVTQNYSAGENGIRGRRIASDGSFPDPAPTMLVPGTYYLFFNIDVHSAGGEYLLSYSAMSTHPANRLSATLAPLGNFSLPSTVARIASNGTMYYVLFTGGLYGNDMRGSPMSTTGVMTIPAGAFFDDLSDGTWWSEDVAWDGANWWVSYLHAWTGLTYQRVSASGAVLDPIGFAIDPVHRNEQGNPQLAMRPAGGVVTVWQDSRIAGATSYDVFAARLTGPSPPLDPGAPISLSAPHQTYADVARAADSYLIAYTSALSGQSRILVQRLDALGQAIDAEPIEVASGPAEATPAVAWNGSLYLCVWNSAGSVVGRRIAADGSLVDPAPVTVMPGGSPDVAAVGMDFLVTATHAPSYPQYRFPYSRRVSGTTGLPIDPNPVVLGNSFAQLCRVAAFGSRWLVTWQRNFSHDDPQSAVEGAFVNTDGTTPGAFTVLFASGGMPDVAVSTQTALFVWRQNSLANANNDIAARRMRADGTFIDGVPFTVSAAPGRQLDPVCVWTGSEFVTTWEDQRNQSAFFDARTELYGSRIPEAGGVSDPTGFEVISGVAPVVNPALAAGGAEEWLVAASIVRTDAPFAGYRVALRTTSPHFATSVAGSPEAPSFRLCEPEPNPSVGGVTVIRYELPMATSVQLGVYDASGRVVRRLASGASEAGSHRIAWDGRNDGGRLVGPGVYFVRMEAAAAGAARKIVVTK